MPLQAIEAPDMAVMLDMLEKPGAVPNRERAILLATLAAAYTEMEKLQGADPKAWQWGKLHHSLPEHPLFQAVDGEMLRTPSARTFPTPGGPYTPNASGYRVNDFQLTGGPSFRMVLDVGNWDNSRAVNYPGQSGNPDDVHYRDLTEMWLTGKYFPAALHARRSGESDGHAHPVAAGEAVDSAYEVLGLFPVGLLTLSGQMDSGAGSSEHAGSARHQGPAPGAERQ